MKKENCGTEGEIQTFAKRRPEDFSQKLTVVRPYWILTESFVDPSKQNEKVGPKIKIFKMKDDFAFALGTNATANDFLRSRWGKGDDLWFHLDGYPGPHLIAKESNMGNINRQSLKVMASALRDSSGLSIEEVPVLFTQVKNLKGVKGAKGKIIYKKEKYMKIEYDKNWRTKVEEK